MKLYNAEDEKIFIVVSAAMLDTDEISGEVLYPVSETLIIDMILHGRAIIPVTVEHNENFYRVAAAIPSQQVGLINPIALFEQAKISISLGEMLLENALLTDIEIDNLDFGEDEND